MKIRLKRIPYIYAAHFACYNAGKKGGGIHEKEEATSLSDCQRRMENLYVFEVFLQACTCCFLEFQFSYSLSFWLGNVSEKGSVLYEQEKYAKPTYKKRVCQSCNWYAQAAPSNFWWTFFDHFSDFVLVILDLKDLLKKICLNN